MTPNSRESRGRLLAIIGGVAVLAAIALALSQVRPPWEERAWRADLARISGLEQLANAIECRHAEAGALPTTLEDLVGVATTTQKPDTICARTAPVHDFEKVEEWCAGCEYRVLAPDRYELCAEFATEMRDTEDATRFSYGGGRRDWRHDAGRNCFELTVAENS